MNTYNVQITLTADANHTFKGDTTSGTTLSNSDKTATLVKNFEVTKADMMLTATGYSGVYDGQSHSAQSITPTLLGSDKATLTYSTDGGTTYSGTEPTIKDKGSKNVSVKASNANYNDATADYTLSVSAKPITVTADDKTKVYGSVNPELTATVVGLVGSDTVTYDLRKASGVKVGTYAITASGAESQGNYTVTYQPGSMTITPATATVKANNAVKYYGEADPVLTATVTGLKFTDTLDYEVTRAAGENANTYVITATGQVTQGNYNVVYENGEFTISRASVTLKDISAGNITYGQKLADSQIQGTALLGTRELTGKWSWVNPDIQPEVGVHKYDVKFVPDDENCVEVTDTATVFVMKQADEDTLTEVVDGRLRIVTKEKTVDGGILVTTTIYNGSTVDTGVMTVSKSLTKGDGGLTVTREADGTTITVSHTNQNAAGEVFKAYCTKYANGRMTWIRRANDLAVKNGEVSFSNVSDDVYIIVVGGKGIAKYVKIGI